MFSFFDVRHDKNNVMAGLFLLETTFRTDKIHSVKTQVLKINLLSVIKGMSVTYL